MFKTSSISNLLSILKQYELYPKKRWGQNFLIDHNIIKKIIDTADINQEDYIVEIGPGLGALTQELVAIAKGVLAVDIDHNLARPLREILGPHKNSRLLFADILEIDIEEELINAFSLAEIPTYKVCANIPYNITTPIIFSLLENSSQLKSATLMMQKEVAARILANPGTKDYGLLTIMVGYYARAELGLNVSRNCFYPKPEVDSTVIKLIPYDTPPVNIVSETVFKDFTKNAFQKRRKTLLNISSSFFKIEKNIAAGLLEEIGINPLYRPEDLSLDDLAKLVNAFL